MNFNTMFEKVLKSHAILVDSIECLQPRVDILKKYFVVDSCSGYFEFSEENTTNYRMDGHKFIFLYIDEDGNSEQFTILPLISF